MNLAQVEELTLCFSAQSHPRSVKGSGPGWRGLGVTSDLTHRCDVLDKLKHTGAGGDGHRLGEWERV